MRKTVVTTLSLAALTFGGVAVAQSTDQWRSIATQRDRDRFDHYVDAWQTGLTEAQRADRAGVRRLGVVLDRTAALARPQPTPGTYQCRTIKLGSATGDRGLTAYGWFRCAVSLSPGGDLMLTKTTGSQRQRGLLYPHNNRQLVFLGSLALSSSERNWPRYGSNEERDLIGMFERIGTNHYRLVMPQPPYESELDILELRRIGR